LINQEQFYLINSFSYKKIEIDDWENFDEDGDANKIATEAANSEQGNQKDSDKTEENSLKNEVTLATTDNNKREKVKPNKKGQPIVEEGIYITTT